MRKYLAIIFLLLAVLNLWSSVGFVVNSVSETLSKIDFDSGEVEEVFCALGSTPNRVALTFEYAYVVNSGDNSIQKINIHSGDTITNIYIENSSNPYDIIIADEYAYVTGGLINKVYKIDLTIDEVINSVNVGGNPAGMAILDGKLFVGNSDYGTGYSNCSVSVIDLNTFSVVETIPTEVNPQFLAAINGNIHVSCGGDWVSIFGKICIIDPVTLAITNTIDIGGVPSNFAFIQNNVVYVADGNGLSLFAYNAETYQIIYDSSNPFTPGGAMVANDDENLFVLGGEWGQNSTVKVFDMNENLLDEYTVGLYATDIKIVPEVVAADEETSIPKNFQLTNYPNPFNPETKIELTLTEPGKIDLAIYNILGQKIKTLIHGSTEQNNIEIVWNGEDDKQRSVASGQYFIKLTVDEQIMGVRKCVLLK